MEKIILQKFYIVISKHFSVLTIFALSSFVISFIDKINSDNKLYLKNSFITSVSQLKKELEKNEYELIISFGQAPLDIDTINIETIGKGDLKYKTKYDYTLLKNNLIKKSYKVIISEDAGTYLCNNIYFNGLKHIKENNLNTEMIFIHIPMIDEITNIENLASIFD